MKLTKILFTISLSVISISLAYSFLYTPIHNNYCERYAEKALAINSRTIDEAEITFKERLGKGEYEEKLCPDDYLKGFFDDIEDKNYDMSEQVGKYNLDCKTRYNIIQEIATEIYPERDSRNKKLIENECKISF